MSHEGGNACEVMVWCMCENMMKILRIVSVMGEAMWSMFHRQ